ncbi:EEF1A N-terminal glycine/lysine methyltransferase [Alternaria panax]|uniref:EEF1A N-terminal glycine/lysine methyltransferase n=1 Tax=Alternaria panax TaxID=48097 RepID=A0AAD4NTD6_9PLEO|nr:EEF1A N-terminal glycine/lysine methyltransferase [Alternaria panax]
MPRRSSPPEESKAQLPSHGDSRTQETRTHKKHHRSHRSRSPRRDDDGHRHKRHRSHSPPAPRPVNLPYNAKPLSKRHYDEYRPLFQSYLDIQKHIQLDDLDEREAKGRWKSFIGRWNRGDLARSWYDPSMLKTAQETIQAYRASSPRAPTNRASPTYTPKEDATSDQSDDDFGPAPPTALQRHTGHGPTIPRLDDLTYRNELRTEEREKGQMEYVDDMRHARKTDRKTQKEALDDLVPRADPGTRERQLEKKRETTSTLNSFRDAKEAGELEVPESDLMGDDGIDVYKKKKKEQERQKNEREIRREEIARAREAERNERLAERREKEGKTMDFLRQIAAERFG